MSLLEDNQERAIQIAKSITNDLLTAGGMIRSEDVERLASDVHALNNYLITGKTNLFGGI